MKLFFPILLVLVPGLLLVSGQVKRSSTSSHDSVSLQPCDVPGAAPGVKEKVLCGALEVFEDRALRRGRKIPIKIVVFPATGRDKSPDPLFYIAGGPGSSATEDAPFLAREFARIRERRDLVFVDQRGAGGSNPLDCTFFDSSDPQSYLDHWNPLEAVRKCRKELERKADLRLYTTPIAMDDLDDVRSALGYQKINIIGGSYGTRAALDYLKRHGKNARSVVLIGSLPAHRFVPRDFPQHTERALNGIIDECAADEACRSAFPDLRADAKAVLERLMRGPVEVEVRFPANSETRRRVKLSRDLAAEAVRYMLYNPGAAARVPLYLHLAARGNFTPLAESAIAYRQRVVGASGGGLYLSITCAEDLPWIKPGEGETNVKNTFLGDYRLRQQREACRLWPRGEISKDYFSPTLSEVPTLLISGQWDPVTPPAYGEMAAKNLPNSLHIVVPSGGHGSGGLVGAECLPNLMAGFINRGTAKGLDTSCVKAIHRKSFILSLENPR